MYIESNNYRENKRNDRDFRTDEIIKDEDDSQKINVEIMPQDDNWEENTTAFTADLSDFNDNMTEDGRASQFNFKVDNNFSNGQENLELKYNLNFYFVRYFGCFCTLIILFSAFITPIMFIVLPRLNIWHVSYILLLNFQKIYFKLLSIFLKGSRVCFRM